MGTTAGTAFTKFSLSASTTYVFRVRAKDNAANVSAWSDELTAVTAAVSGGGGGSSSPPPTLRFVSETLGATVHYDAATREITITR